jgi:hypothetical protein
VPLEYARVDLPIVAAQGETLRLTRGVGQHGIELLIADAGELRLQGRLLARQPLVAHEVEAEQHGACRGQKKYQRRQAVQCARSHAAAAETAPRLNQKNQADQRTHGGDDGNDHGRVRLRSGN